MQPGDIGQFAWRTVRFRGIEGQLAVEFHHVPDLQSKFPDADLFAGADVDKSRDRRIVEKALEIPIRKCHQKVAGIGKIVHMEEFTQRGAAPPEGDRR